MSEAFPDAIVLLSIRNSDSWWESASQTVLRTQGLVSPEWDAMNDAISSSRFATSTSTRESAIRGYNLHNDRVRETVGPQRLLEWTASDGWEPICSAEGVGELQRMYVAPALRGRGIGRAIANRLIDDARLIGHRRLKLESLEFLDAAHSLYRSIGFSECEPYGDNSMNSYQAPEQLDRYYSITVFMEMEL